MAKVKVQRELLWMIISGYEHEKQKKKKKKKKKKRRNIMYLSKTKMGKRETILEAVHSMYFYLWIAFKVLVVRKKRHESNKFVEIVHAL